MMGIDHRHYDMGVENFHGETDGIVSMDVMGFHFFDLGDLDDTKIGCSLDLKRRLREPLVTKSQSKTLVQGNTNIATVSAQKIGAYPNFGCSPTILHVKLHPRVAGQNNLVKLQFGTHSSHVQYRHILKFSDMT